APQASAAASPAQRAATYLARAQNADGGWGAVPRARTSAAQTSWAVVGLAAAGYDPLRVRTRGRTPLALLRSYASRSRATADLQRTAIALAAAGLTVPRDLRARLRADQRRDGSWDGLVNLTSFGIIALRASGSSTSDGAVRRARSWLARRQSRDGGFNFAGAGRSGVDDTAAAVQALVASGLRRSRAVRRAAAWIAARQNPDGGFALTPPGSSNAQSTAYAVQALVAAGRDPDRVRRPGSRTPLAYLRSLQQSSGLVRYSRTSAQTPIWVTSQALAAFARRPLPFRLRRR
ncbi:MAG: hypothetical protein LT070_03200, partial [Solirubrobacteraceae bacterium]|nr:hypothetical protein [Solirubrobacteraceae bacterium]